jgi:hypothetical protein
VEIKHYGALKEVFEAGWATSDLAGRSVFQGAQKPQEDQPSLHVMNYSLSGIVTTILGTSD